MILLGLLLEMMRVRFGLLGVCVHEVLRAPRVGCQVGGIDRGELLLLLLLLKRWWRSLLKMIWLLSLECHGGRWCLM